MNTRPLLSALFASVCLAAGSPAAGMSFFVTSVGLGKGADLGGLDGADRHCQALATAAGVGERAWRAYLSTSTVDARDRIGAGPWMNARGVVVARDLDELHSDRNHIDRHTALTEFGAAVEKHDMLTGSTDDGRLATIDGAPATCSDWTSSGDGAAMAGHHDRFLWPRGQRFPRWRSSWNAAHETLGCDAERLAESSAEGLYYCFASDRSEEERERPPAERVWTATFRRGVNIAHWLSHNVPDSYEYAAPWFGEEDVAWIASQGFDHLRMRVASDQWINSNGDIDEAKIAPFDDVLRWAREHRLGVVLTMFSFPGYHSEPAGAEQAPWPYRTDEETFADAEYAWWQVARRYAGEGAGLRFEILHRPDAPDAAEIVRFHRAMLGAIRATNPQRLVYLAGHDMQRESLADLPLAEFGDPNLALAFEFFEPLAFTFQFDESKPLREFPGEGDFALAELDRKIDAVGKWSKANAAGREIYVAAFGVYARAGDISARAFLAGARTAFERNGLAWAVYDYQSGCAVRGDDGKPTRNLEALFPREVPATKTGSV